MNRFFLLLVILSGFGFAAEKQNVLFIAVDDLRPALGCYGDPIAKTPEIDKLAARGTVFTNAMCQWPVCGPTRASLMTSLYPEQVGVMDLKTDMRAKNPDVLTLPEHFKNNGYLSAGTGKIYDPRCVDSKKANDKRSWSIPFSQLPHGELLHNDVKEFALAPDVADEKLADGYIARDGVAMMRELAAGEKPFFLAVGFKKPHLPFIAPKKYWDLYQRDELPLAEYTGGIENDSGYVLHDSPEMRGYGGVPKSGPIPEKIQREAIHGYYACVSFIDAQVGLLMKELDELGLAENTHIVLWGDHGFHLGDHSMWGKHSTLEAAARVPLIFAPAGGSEISETNAPVEFTDIFPTLCDLAGVPAAKGKVGRSLVPIIDGSRGKIRDGAITVFNKKGANGYSYRTERYRYTEWINKFGKLVATDLFDYETDPHETRNLAADPDKEVLVSELSAMLRRDAVGCERLQKAAQD